MLTAPGLTPEHVASPRTRSVRRGVRNEYFQTITGQAP